jgi:hypothetical protein
MIQHPLILDVAVQQRNRFFSCNHGLSPALSVLPICFQRNTIASGKTPNLQSVVEYASRLPEMAREIQLPQITSTSLQQLQFVSYQSGMKNVLVKVTINCYKKQKN